MILIKYISKKIILSIVFFASITISNADIYPVDDETFTSIVQYIYHKASDDDEVDIHNYPGTADITTFTRSEICELLVNRHNTLAFDPAVPTSTNANYIGQSLTVSVCENAFWYSQGYDDLTGFGAWQGNMAGFWHNDSGGSFDDAARWEAPFLDADGYAIQSVLFLGIDREGDARFGWNVSHPDAAYIWGWDAKNNELNDENGDDVINDDDKGLVGTHVGWTFDQGSAHCIIWLTPKEAFLECVTEMACPKRRSSTGVFGLGQWSVAGLGRCGPTKPRVDRQK